MDFTKSKEWDKQGLRLIMKLQGRDVELNCYKNELLGYNLGLVIQWTLGVAWASWILQTTSKSWSK